MEPALPLHALIGESEAIQQLRLDIASAARAQAKVLILGETGSGKEVTAHLVHRLGPRQHARFVALNCSGVPETLLESELFGHLRGSFTGAFRDKPGLAKVADRGTLFLDEVGEMSLRMQASVLRFVETGEIQPVGGVSSFRTDVRLISATNRNLRDQIATREFREDLFHRLNVIQIVVPPLRDRADDVTPLLQYYLGMFSQIHSVPRPELTDGVTRRLREYRWPGNVRELKNIAERLTVRGTPRITEEDLPIEIRAAVTAAPVVAVVHKTVPGQSSIVEDAWARLMMGESFWTVVHAAFKSHDMTRMELRALIRRGLQQTQGSYRALVPLFGMEARDYRRFLSFLYQYDCNLPFQPHRSGPSNGDGLSGENVA
jgi:DNA-binding NtrC family response regulator